LIFPFPAFFFIFQIFQVFKVFSEKNQSDETKSKTDLTVWKVNPAEKNKFSIDCIGKTYNFKIQMQIAAWVMLAVVAIASVEWKFQPFRKRCGGNSRKSRDGVEPPTMNRGVGIVDLLGFQWFELI